MSPSVTHAALKAQAMRLARLQQGDVAPLPNETRVLHYVGKGPSVEAAAFRTNDDTLTFLLAMPNALDSASTPLAFWDDRATAALAATGLRPRVSARAQKAYTAGLGAEVRAALEAQQTSNAVVAGYGSGSLLAMLVAAHLGLRGLPVTCVVFGAPHCGNEDFASLLELSNVNLHRVVRREDALVAWPPSASKRPSPGREVVLQRDGGLAFCSPHTGVVGNGLPLWVALFAAVLSLATFLGTTTWATAAAWKAGYKRDWLAAAFWTGLIGGLVAALASYTLYNGLHGLSATHYAEAIEPPPWNKEPSEADTFTQCKPHWPGTSMGILVVLLLLLVLTGLAFRSLHASPGASLPLDAAVAINALLMASIFAAHAI